MTCILKHSGTGGGRGGDSHFINIWRIRLGASNDPVRFADHKTCRAFVATCRGRENHSTAIDRR